MTQRLIRIAALGAVGAVLIAATPTPESRLANSAVSVVVYKDPNCGCCKNWIEHLRKHGYQVTAKDTSDMGAVKTTLRVPAKMQSCHTAVVNGYVIEGHVPAADIDKLLAAKPKVAGIAVPGMPVGSPGMEMGNRVDKYDVVAFNRDGSTSVFAKH